MWRSRRDVSLTGVFSDAGGDPLTVIARSSDVAEATVPISADHSKLTLAGMSEGSATITFKVEDADANRVNDRFEVSARNRYAGLVAQMKKRRIDRCWTG